MRLLPLFSLLLPFLSAEPVERAQYDVCVIGGGAFGMSASVFAKDKGYSVVVLDSANEVGGHCDTYKQTVPVPPGLPDWLDLGVATIADTSAANLAFDGNATNGRWKISTKQFFQRFVGRNGIRDVDFTSLVIPTWLIDVPTQFSLGPVFPQPPSPEYLAAYGRLVGIVRFQYPQLDTGLWDGPVPSELLVPFADYMVAHNLTVLADTLRPLLFLGGLGQFKNLTTFYALRNLAPTILRIFDTPGGGFEILGGCQTFYNGMNQYLGLKNIKVNATVTSIKRPRAGQPIPNWNKYPIKIQGVLKNVGKPHRQCPNRKAQPPIIRTIPFQYECGHLVLGLPQLPSNHKVIGLDVDATETSLFSSVKARGYYSGLATLQGGVTEFSSNPVYQFAAFNPLSPPLHIPTAPTGWLGVGRNLPIPGSPSPLYSYSNEPLPEDTIATIVQQQLNQLPAALGVNHTQVLQVISHIFQAHPDNTALASSPGWYASVRALQGQRRTIWGGATVNFAGHHILINDAYVTIQRVLPKKK